MQQLAFPATSCNLIHQMSIIPKILLDHLCYYLSVTDTREAELSLKKRQKTPPSSKLMGWFSDSLLHSDYSDNLVLF